MLPVILVAVGAYLIGDSVLEDGKKYAKGGYMAKGGEFDRPKESFEISVPYNFEKVVKDEYDFVEFLSKTLTKKWFGSGVWGVKFTKKLYTKNDNQYVNVEVEIPLAFKSVDKFEIEELLSKALTKKYFGNGVWGVKQVSKKADGGYMAKGGESLSKNFNTQMNVGKSKYVINYHNGEKTHKDGSPFYDLATFKNKKDFDARKKALIAEGYKEI